MVPQSKLPSKFPVTPLRKLQHGAALGLGIAGMGSKNMDSFDDLKTVLFTDSAVAGEASGYAVFEMLQYARETQHEKIIRGLAMGTAFIFYGRQEEADETIKVLLLAEKVGLNLTHFIYDLNLAIGSYPQIRWCLYSSITTYAGPANNDAVRRLLHIAVSDTSDDVRRAAVTSLAFLLFKNPGQVPRVVQLLSESYNPHVRCSATLALGIACAGTGLQV